MEAGVSIKIWLRVANSKTVSLLWIDSPDEFKVWLNSCARNTTEWPGFTSTVLETSKKSCLNFGATKSARPIGNLEKIRQDSHRLKVSLIHLNQSDPQQLRLFLPLKQALTKSTNCLRTASSSMWSSQSKRTWRRKRCKRSKTKSSTWVRQNSSRLNNS